MAQKPALGKGLASLFPNATAPAIKEKEGKETKEKDSTINDSKRQGGVGATAAGAPTTAAQQEVANRDRHPGISVVAIDDIVANQFQPRRDFDDVALKELAQSIKINGVIQPLVVRKTAQGYQLIAGERRLRASKLAGLKQVPIVIRRSTDREALELALIENIQRQNLNCIDEALAYFQLTQEFSLTQEEVANRVGKERATVANYMRLLKLPEAIIDDLKRQILSFGHGKALLSVDDVDVRLRARQIIVEKHLSVREAEALVDSLKRQALETGDGKGKDGKEPHTPLQTRLFSLSQELTRSWSTKVELKGSERRGKIVVHYSSRQELERILAEMQSRSR